MSRLMLATLAVLAAGGAASASAAPRDKRPNPCAIATQHVAGDGITDNTMAIQATMDACAASGGGLVEFPAGTYLTGPFTLGSHIVIVLDTGATILGTTDQYRYANAYIGTPYQPNEALVSAVGAQDVAIVGTGTIDGQGGVAPAGGQSWWALAAAAKAAGTAYPGYPYIPTSNGLPRPWLVEFWNCRNVVVEGVHLQNSPMWTLALRYVTNAAVVGVTVAAPSTSPNTDGTDVVSSKQVLIDGVNYADGDDDVAIKSGLPPIYQSSPLPAVPSANVTVQNSTFGSGHGVSVGSETINGMHDITISNITYNGTADGFRIKTGRDRGNQIRNITVRNLTMTGVGTPFSISAYYPTIPPCCADPAQPIGPTTPFIHNVTLENITDTGASNGGFVIGLPESPIEQIRLKNINIATAKATDAALELRNVQGRISNVTVSPTASGTNTIVDGGVDLSGQTLP